MMTDDIDDIVERVRMCVAEAGYDPIWITPMPPEAQEQGFYFANEYMMIPHDVCWRAREIALVGEPKCFSCSTRHLKMIKHKECRAVRRLELNCGAYEDKETNDPHEA
jgi:hypothetical protein